MEKRVLVIGAGASGMTAAVVAARRGCQVTLIEGNDRIGKKLLATGNGKCNFTNRYLSSECFRSETPDAVWAVLSRFGTEDTIRFLGSLGIEPAERNGYVYPASGQAASVVSVFETELKHLGVELVLGKRVTEVTGQKGAFFAAAGEERYKGSAVILACGSKAGISPNKEAGGYELAQRMGHSLTRMVPGLTGLRGKGNWLREWSGVRREGRIAIYESGGRTNRLLAEDTGELQLTDYGISGIPAFQVSRFAAMALAEGKQVQAEIDFFPGLSDGELLSLLIDRRNRMKYKTCRELLVGLLPDKLAGVCLKRTGAAEGKRPDERALSGLADCMKSWAMPITAVNPISQAQVCAGGVRLTQINGATMESRLAPGLYLTGEMLDAEGICGGYNLQWAWATGAIAGRSVLR